MSLLNENSILHYDIYPKNKVLGIPIIKSREKINMSLTLYNQILYKKLDIQKIYANSIYKVIILLDNFLLISIIQFQIKYLIKKINNNLIEKSNNILKME